MICSKYCFVDLPVCLWKQYEWEWLVEKQTHRLVCALFERDTKKRSDFIIHFNAEKPSD